MLLGELLSYLRTKKMMTSLLLCRQIKNFEINNNIAKIIASDETLKEISANDKCKAEISEFLERKGLSLKLIEIQEKQNNELETLNSLLGGKLIIKSK